jgi:hypothetical protein
LVFTQERRGNLGWSNVEAAMSTLHHTPAVQTGSPACQKWHHLR